MTWCLSSPLSSFNVRHYIRCFHGDRYPLRSRTACIENFTMNKPEPASTTSLPKVDDHGGKIDIHGGIHCNCGETRSVHGGEHGMGDAFENKNQVMDKFASRVSLGKLFDACRTYF